MCPLDGGDGSPHAWRMESLDAFLTRAYRYAEARKMAPATLSHRLFNEGKRLARLKAGDSKITTERLSAASERLTELEQAERATVDTS